MLRFGAVTVSASVVQVRLRLLLLPATSMPGIVVLFRAAMASTISGHGARRSRCASLTINGQGGDNGVLVVADNSKVAIESCEISNAGASGVEFTGPDTMLSIRNSVLRGNFLGIHARPYAAGKGTMIVTDSVIADSATSGLEAHSNVSGSSLVVYADRITATGNVPSGTGVSAISDAGTSTLVAVSNRTISGNGFGLGTQGTGSPKMTVSTSVVAGNSGPGLSNFAGIFLSRGDNHVHDNNGGRGADDGAIGFAAANLNDCTATRTSGRVHHQS